MSIANLPVGNVARIEGKFTDVDKVPTDPSEVTVYIHTPDGEEATYTFQDDEVDNPETGTFRLDYELTMRGDHLWKMIGTGVIDAERTGVINAFDHYASP